MDPLDFEIYRFLSPGGEARFWAGRRVIDPTIPAREIAEKVGISENGVRVRLRHLSDRGFLRGRTLTPNPSLFHAHVLVAELPVHAAGEVERIYRDLALVDGVIFARDTLDEGERQVGVYFVADSDASAARRASLLRRLSPRGELGSPQRYSIPSCERALSPLDWRLLQALSRAPELPIAEIARAVGVSLKTAARRYRELIESRAFWWTHSADSEEFPLALIRIDLTDPAHREPLLAGVRDATPTWMPVAPDGLGLDPEAAANVIAGLVPADAPVVLERTVRTLGGLPGVKGIRRTFALGSMTYPGWFTERIADRVPARAK